MQAGVRITEWDIIGASRAQIDAIKDTVVACQEHRALRLDYCYAIVVNVSDPNPDKVHAVLEACAAIGVVLG